MTQPVQHVREHKSAHQTAWKHKNMDGHNTATEARGWHRTGPGQLCQSCTHVRWKKFCRNISSASSVSNAEITTSCVTAFGPASSTPLRLICMPGELGVHTWRVIPALGAAACSLEYIAQHYAYKP
jgi:hypothetical protein